LTWHEKFVKDVLGIYHIGVVVYDVEYSFGNSRAPFALQLGGPQGGVFMHTPQQAGPHNVFKQSVDMGAISLTDDRVKEIATSLSLADFPRQSYNRYQHNCADFAQEFCLHLGVDAEFPHWCHRGSSAAKLVGLGLDSQNGYSDSKAHLTSGCNTSIDFPDTDIDVLAEVAMKKGKLVLPTRGPTLLTSRADFSKLEGMLPAAGVESEVLWTSRTSADTLPEERMRDVIFSSASCRGASWDSFVPNDEGAKSCSMATYPHWLPQSHRSVSHGRKYLTKAFVDDLVGTWKNAIDDETEVETVVAM
jgi:hypothetical protein